MRQLSLDSPDEQRTLARGMRLTTVWRDDSPVQWVTCARTTLMAVKHWSLTMLREKLIKIGAKVVRHAGYVTFQRAEVAEPRQLSRAIPDRIRRLRLLPVLARAG